MRWPAWVPPAYAPLPPRALAAGAHALLSGRDDRALLAAGLRRRYDALDVHLVESGTAALEVALRLARVVAGDSIVALPAYGCYDLATAAVGCGARIVLYDLDPATLAPDLDSLTSALTAGARTVVAAPVAGLPLDWSEVDRCASAFGAVVVEDAAQAHGAEWLGRPVGARGAISVLSFARGKGWTGGRGGAVCIRDGVIAEFARGLAFRAPSRRAEWRDWTLAAALASLSNPRIYGAPASLPFLRLGETRYREPRPLLGMTRVAAAVLLASRAAADDEATIRRLHADAWLAQLHPWADRVTVIAPTPESLPGYLRLPVRMSPAPRARAIAIGQRLGIAIGYPASLDAIPTVQARLAARGPWPGASALARELITLPTHSRVDAATRAAALAAVIDARSETRRPSATPSRDPVASRRALTR